MRSRLWMALVGVGIVFALTLLASPKPTLADDLTCEGPYCVAMDPNTGEFHCYPLGSPQCGGSCGTGCTSIYLGHVLSNSCAYNGGNGACWCPLPGEITSNGCH